MRRFVLPIFAIFVFAPAVRAEEKKFDCGKCYDHKWIHCPVCKDAKVATYDCPHCAGTGGTACIMCDGKGKKPCPACGGKGFAGSEGNGSNAGGSYGTCKTCHGNKEITCPTCKGKGKIDCTFCKGKGKVKGPCLACAATGKLECMDCLNWPVAVGPPGVDASEAGLKAVKDLTDLLKPSDMKALEGQMKSAFPGNTGYGLERVQTPSVMAWHDDTLVVLPILIDNMPEQAEPDWNQQQVQAMRNRNQKVFDKCLADTRKLIKIAWGNDWVHKAKGILLVIAAPVLEKDECKIKPMLACQMRVDYLEKLDLSKEDAIDVLKMAAWKVVSAKMQ